MNHFPKSSGFPAEGQKYLVMFLNIASDRVAKGTFLFFNLCCVKMLLKFFSSFVLFFLNKINDCGPTHFFFAQPPVYF